MASLKIKMKGLKMKKLTMHEMAERYKIMSCIGGEYKCPKCKKGFDFCLTNFDGLHLVDGLCYKCPHCGKMFSLKIYIKNKLGK